jgi:HSP20 family protein
VGGQPWPGPGWDPVGDLAVIKQEMNRLFENLLGPGAAQGRPAEGAWAPPVDVCETRDELRVLVELPGISLSQVKLEIAEGVLTVRGERHPESAFRQDQLQRMECHYGLFVRRLSLPSVVDADHVRASYRDGVLEIRLPKRQQAGVRTIAIEKA